MLDGFDAFWCCAYSLWLHEFWCLESDLLSRYIFAPIMLHGH